MNAHHTSALRTRTLRRNVVRGFTLIELLMVVSIVGIMMAVVVPKFRISQETEVQLAAMQLAQDIDLARTRALSTRSIVRLVFNSGSRKYFGYLDDNQDGYISQSNTELVALRGFATRTLPTRVDFGKGSASNAPDDAGSSAITFPSSLVNFDSRGLTTPMGTSGTVYVRSSTKASAVAAVTLSPAGSVRIWTWRNGSWQ